MKDIVKATLTKNYVYSVRVIKGGLKVFSDISLTIRISQFKIVHLIFVFTILFFIDASILHQIWYKTAVVGKYSDLEI